MKGDAASAKALAEEELGITDEEVATLDFDQATQQPRIKQSGGLLRFWWDAEQIQAYVSRLHQHRDGRVTAEIKLTTSAPGYRSHLHQAQLNLVATRSKQDLAKALLERRNDLDWTTIVEQLCYHTLDRSREGEPVVQLWTSDPVSPPRYALAPFLPELEPAVIYGPGESGKSMLALVMGICVQLPWTDNPLGLNVEERKPVLYLDWETDESRVHWRLACLQRGLGLPDFYLDYRRMALPLADDQERIQHVCQDKDIGLIIVDSVAAAAGGDIYKPEPALRMFATLRQLRLSSLLVAHTPKTGDSIFGTAFFRNYARSVWEVKKVQEVEDKHIDVGLYDDKGNDRGKVRPIGFKISFGEAQTSVKRIDLAGVADLAAKLPLRQRIKHALGDNGKMTVDALAEQLATSKGTVRDKLYDLLHRKEVVKIGQEWALLCNSDV